MRSALLGGRRVVWAQAESQGGWRPLALTHSPDAAGAAAAGEHRLRLGESEAGTLVAQHSMAFTLSAQKEAIEQVRRRVLDQPTQHLHTRSLEGVHNMLMVLRFLHDFEGRLEQMQGGAAEAAEGVPTCGWSSLELFCRPWVVGCGHGRYLRGTELLRLEEHIPSSLRILCAVLSPWGVPLGSLLAWVTLQSPAAFCRLHLRRIIGPHVAPCRVQLDLGYRVEDEGLSVEALASAAAAGGARDLVRGGIPQLGGARAA
uniref:Uncharacterized protein n=1 Tax=Pyrodinium bahamense TaxID=73915 RepID=A0A7S0AAF1_9DINO|mmetsp:Transcript_29587/g.81344  ORF Transcript_29587/g.81344 Transcript_29587/m.81344 type:complete len:258 (+) Transcript_29587:101-874(+)